MTDREARERLVEAVASAWRPRDAYGLVEAHPAWADLDDASRAEAFDVTLSERALEAALDPRGLTSTARAVLGRLSPGE